MQRPLSTPSRKKELWPHAAFAAADAARNNGFCGADLLEAEENMLVTDLRLTPFLARKIIKARDDFLGES